MAPTTDIATSAPARYPVVQAAVFLIATLHVPINLAVDMLYANLTPQIRYR